MWGTSVVPAGRDWDTETGNDTGVLAPSGSAAGTDAGTDAEVVAGTCVEALPGAEPTAEICRVTTAAG